MSERRGKSRTGLEAREDSALQEALGEIRAIYQALEERPAERDCQGRTMCCRFRLTGEIPRLTRGEALAAAAAWRAAGRKVLPESGSEDGACPFLGENGRCGIYLDRPFACRTHFCAAAGGKRERASVIDLIRRLEAVDEALDGEGPKPLRSAVAQAWEIAGRPRKRR